MVRQMVDESLAPRLGHLEERSFEWLAVNPEPLLKDDGVVKPLDLLSNCVVLVDGLFELLKRRWRLGEGFVLVLIAPVFKFLFCRYPPVFEEVLEVVIDRVCPQVLILLEVRVLKVKSLGHDSLGLVLELIFQIFELLGVNEVLVVVFLARVHGHSRDKVAHLEKVCDVVKDPRTQVPSLGGGLTGRSTSLFVIHHGRREVAVGYIEAKRTGQNRLAHIDFLHGTGRPFHLVENVAH
mmetsp:Transcript_24997/g.75303  ORF Transcript_24997/g.75303 Transcript_24997/m.75303 type:complete len:237 (-) Transcript_24997:2682-3392(-)